MQQPGPIYFFSADFSRYFFFIFILIVHVVVEAKTGKSWI